MIGVLVLVYDSDCRLCGICFFIYWFRVLGFLIVVLKGFGLIYNVEVKFDIFIGNYFY